MSSWNDPLLCDLFLKSTPLIDVRAPVEFESGSVPNSINLPIMTNEERAQVGTCYKLKGQQAAMELGHGLVSGEIKAARISAWTTYIKEHPDCQVFCFRGGLRSQIACRWLRELGHELYPIEGGYKQMRSFFLSWLEEAPIPNFFRIGGLTGTGKTGLLSKLHNAIDIEGLAKHRGSAFGGYSTQPAQITFENRLASELIRARNWKTIVLEDESATLGRISLPLRFYSTLRNSPLIVLKVDDEKRNLNIYNDYVKDSDADFFLNGLLKIKKRISSADYNELHYQVNQAFSRTNHGPDDHRPWISILLNRYYDPLYNKDLKRNAEHIVFEGNEQDVLEYLSSQ